MSSPQSPAPYISRTKVTPPATSRYEVLRQAILDHASEGNSRRVVLIRAPAGFGKTTLMTQMVSRFQRQGLATVWLTLDRGDNDISRFLKGFSTAIASLQLDSSQDLKQMSNVDLVSWILERIAEHPTPMAIFFDDFETIRNPVVRSLVARSIEMISHKDYLIIGCRTLPEIGLARLRAHGLLMEINAAELRFNTQEVHAFLTQRRSINLSSAQVEKLQNSTEGWATALWLASLALENHGDTDKFLDSFSGSNTAIAAYLAEDVLAALEPRLRDFLLRSSVIDELSPALCNALCDVNDSVEVLHELERLQMFLVLVDEQRNLYRYHSLFLDFLRHQLQRHHADELPGLHQAACAAYLAEGRAIPAIRHALLSGSTHTAIHLLYLHVDNLIGQGRMRLLAECIGQIPKKELRRHPRLRLIQAWSTTFIRGPHEALALVRDMDEATLEDEPAMLLRALRPMLLVMMDRVEEARELGVNALVEASTDYPFAWAMLNQALTQISIILGQREQAYRFVDEARQAQNESAGAFGFVLAESAEAQLEMMTGRLKQATARLRQASTMLEASRRRSQNGNALVAVQLAEALYESDECTEAQRLLQIFTPLAHDLGLSDALIIAHTLLARMAGEQNDHDRALQLLNELENIGHRSGLLRVTASARLERAMLTLARGDLAGALEQLTLAEQTFPWSETSNHWFIGNDTLIPTVARLRWMIRSGSAAKAIGPLRSELAEAERQLRGRRALKLRILLAEALYANNQAKMALRTLERALTFARTEGFVRTFLEEGSTVQAMLRELHTVTADVETGDGQERWLRHSYPLQMATVVPGSLTDPLTKKELKALQLLSQGLSNAEMAEKMFVSDSTVRTHLRNINLKLHASSRSQAVAIARKLGLCP